LGPERVTQTGKHRLRYILPVKFLCKCSWQWSSFNERWFSLWVIIEWAPKFRKRKTCSWCK